MAWNTTSYQFGCRRSQIAAHDPGRWAATPLWPDREHQLVIRLVPHGPADRPPRAGIQQQRRMEPPRLGENQGDLPGSQAIEHRPRNALLGEIGCRMKQ